MSTVQTGNTAGRDIVGGDKYERNTVYVSPPTSLSRLYEILREEDRAAHYTAQIADMLRHYCAAKSADVLGLEEKLAISGRAYLVEEASELKERAAKLIMKWQTSPVAQDIITHVLAKLHGEFMMRVRPAIQAGKSAEEVDEIISDKVVGPTEEMLGDNDLGITLVDVLGFLYFLGGNCHLRWDKC